MPVRRTIITSVISILRMICKTQSPLYSIPGSVPRLLHIQNYIQMFRSAKACQKMQRCAHRPARDPICLSRLESSAQVSLTAPANQKSQPPDTANTEKDVTALVTASPYAPKTAALVVVAVAHLQPTQQQRKHANRVRNGLTAGLGGAHGTHHVDGPRARQHQPSPSPDARGAHPTCRSQVSAQTLPHAPATTQTQQK